MIDIIIPTFGQEEHTIACLESIRKYKDRPYRIIWVDNGSTFESRSLVMGELVKHKYLTIWSGSRLGFIRAVNLGIKASNAEYVVIMNNDTKVTDGWLERLQYPLDKEDIIMASGPNTTASTSRQSWDILKRDQKQWQDMPDLTGLDDESIIDVLFEKYGNKYYRTDVLAFFCTMFKRIVFDIVGLLDEDYDEGYSDDVDYSIRIHKAGYEMVFVPSVFIHHLNRTTFLSIYNNKEISKKLHDNRKLLKKKHS